MTTDIQNTSSPSNLNVKRITAMANKLKTVIGYFCRLWQTMLVAYPTSLVISSLLGRRVFNLDMYNELRSKK